MPSEVPSSDRATIEKVMARDASAIMARMGHVAGLRAACATTDRRDWPCMWAHLDNHG